MNTPCTPANTPPTLKKGREEDDTPTSFLLPTSSGGGVEVVETVEGVGKVGEEGERSIGWGALWDIMNNWEF